MRHRNSPFIVTVTLGSLWMLFLYSSPYLRKRSIAMPTPSLFAPVTGAHALSSAASVPKRRVFCFGDSLTAGTSDDVFALFPYAPHLESSLNTRLGQDDNTTNNVLVQHHGIPGWTTTQMLNDLDGSQGLRTFIRAAQPVALVVLLAGTNDLGYTSDPSVLVGNLAELHQACQNEGVPRTLAIGVPPSAYQSMVKEAADMARRVNQQLQDYCVQNAPKTTYMEFPFAFSRTEGNFAKDGLHFTPQGYQLLGESLAPIVEQILDDTAEP